MDSEHGVPLFSVGPFSAPQRIGGGCLRESPYSPEEKVPPCPGWQQNLNSESAGRRPTDRLL